MKAVWLINHYAQVPGGVGGTRHYSLARKLARHGWDVSLIGASVEHNTGRQRLARGEWNRLDTVEGIKALWLWTPGYAGSGAKRIVNMVAFTASLLLRGLARDLPKPDLIIGSTVHPFAAWAAMRLAKRYQVPFVFEVRDLWPETLIEMGRLKRDSWMARWLYRLERTLFDKASRIIVLLPAAERYVRDTGVAGEKVLYLPNAPDLDFFPEPEPPPKNERFQLAYIGAHGPANDLENILQALQVFQERYPDLEVDVRFVGDGASKPALIEMAETLGLKGVTFEAPVKKEDVRKVGAEADAFIVSLKDLPLYRFGISLNKLYEYMAMGRPVIFAGAAVNDPVREAGAGMTVAPGQPADFAEAIHTLVLIDPAVRDEMGRAGRRYVERQMSLDALSEDLARCLDDCIQEDAKRR